MLKNLRLASGKETVNPSPFFKKILQKNNDIKIECMGIWSIEELSRLQEVLSQENFDESNNIEIDGHQLTYLDSASALTLVNFSTEMQSAGKKVRFSKFSKEHQGVLDLILRHEDALAFEPPPKSRYDFLCSLGEETLNKLKEVHGVVILIGDLFIRLIDACYHLRRFRLPAIISNIDSAGIKALPILALLSFLIGIVLAYQMGLQLQTYGANTFIAYLSGMAIFREFAPLITAIIVAGRTSSAYTAQLGSMKINEEIDALYTMGLSPTALLVVPKVLGLFFIFPLLIFWSDIFSILGAMVMSQGMLDIGYVDFLNRLKEQVGMKQFMLGQYKAPAFSLIISIVGCFQGFAVKSNADSIGSQTTKSVVQALFLIIIADAIYSVIYSWLDL